MPKQKASINLALKFAIIESRLRQRAVAMKAGIPETRLSEIVNGRCAPPNIEEKAALAAVLGKRIIELFPSVAHAGGARA